jgi:hypothetical protein
LLGAVDTFLGFGLQTASCMHTVEVTALQTLAGPLTSGQVLAPLNCNKTLFDDQLTAGRMIAKTIEFHSG